jgi:hypothetical protein
MTGLVPRMPRLSAATALASALTLVLLPGIGTAARQRAGESGTTQPAVVTLQAGSARLKGSGEDRRLVLTSVDPDTATFQVEGGDEAPINAKGAVGLLSTRPLSVAVVRPLEGGSQEAERLRLGRLKYDWPRGTLTAVARPATSGAVTSLLRQHAPSADGDGKLPKGPVELVLLDTDTEATDSGAPLPPRRASATSSYSIPMRIEYSGRIGYHITGKVTASHCINASGFTVDTPIPPREDARYDATSFSVDTGGDCFWEFASVSYDVSVEQNGPITLSVQQVGPRAFVTKCTDKWPIASKCQFLPQQQVFLHI